MSDKDTEDIFLDQLCDFLRRSDVTRFFLQHPNELTSHKYAPSPAWSSWWNWPVDRLALKQEGRWELLWRYYQDPDNADPRLLALIPAELQAFIREARLLQLRREQAFETSVPATIPVLASDSLCSKMSKTHGMSPKKAHEVACTIDYAKNILLNLQESGLYIRHVVDVGAGQAYLSRALRDELGLHVLALDWSTVQSDGAVRRENTKKKGDKRQKAEGNQLPQGSLTYETLSINPESLIEVVDKWLATSAAAFRDEKRKIPVLFVALHACGSLTLDIFRAITLQVQSSSDARLWRPAAALVVGCCYNLLRHEDQISLTGRHIGLAENHLQMAAQAPSQWCRSPAALASTKLAFRKTTWRALLSGLIHERGASEDPEMTGKRLGRVNNSAYDSWSSFLQVASQKFEMDFNGARRDEEAEGRVEVFQFLRCILGPVVESFLILDRKLWLKAELKERGFDTRLINLFDQSSGSARNVAIVLAESERFK